MSTEQKAPTETEVTPLEDLRFYKDEGTRTFIPYKLAKQKLTEELGFKLPKNGIVVPANFYRQENAFTSRNDNGTVIFNSGHAKPLFVQGLVMGHQIMFVRGEKYDPSNPEKATLDDASVFIVGEIDEFIKNCENDIEKLSTLFDALGQEIGTIVTKIYSNKMIFDYTTDVQGKKTLLEMQEVNKKRLVKALNILNTFLENTKEILQQNPDHDGLKKTYRTINRVVAKIKTLEIDSLNNEQLPTFDVEPEPQEVLVHA